MPNSSLRHFLLPLILPAALSGFGLFLGFAHGGERAARSDLTQADLDRVAAVTQPARDFGRAEAFEAMTAGAATFMGAPDRNAFSHGFSNMPFAREEDFRLGRALFKKLWVSAPSSTQASDGLGPLYNARSCMSCHIDDGRGRPPEAGMPSQALVLRLAQPYASNAAREAAIHRGQPNLPDPVYGRQLQELAVPGLAAEGRAHVDYSEAHVLLAGGEAVTLRRPRYSIADPAYGPLDPATTISPRMAPAMIGLGLIESIPEAEILAHADPEDVDGDGISGRAAMALDRSTGRLALGRFGWKAQTATIRDQAADAFSTDIGISTPLSTAPAGDCTERQSACLARPDGVQARLGPQEAPGPVLDLVTFYARSLAPPARRRPEAADRLAGKAVFYTLGCAGCHVPKFVTRRDATEPNEAFQLIWPYSDFLLHDMGEGLADGQEVGVASGREWRTPPLWGIGLTRTVSGHSFFLHDGRARSLSEAILWHGGEAEKARNGFAEASPRDRQALMTFLESL